MSTEVPRSHQAPLPLPRNRLLACALAIAAATAVAAFAAAPATGDDGATLLRAGLAGSQPTDAKIANATAGGRPWVNRPSSVRVTSRGELRAEVRGLVIPDAPFNGTNPVATLAASLVCNGVVVATTAAVPFSPAGNAEIEATVTVPSRCLAPAVLLNPGGNAAVFIGASGLAS